MAHNNKYGYPDEYKGAVIKIKQYILLEKEHLFNLNIIHDYLKISKNSMIYENDNFNEYVKKYI